MISNYNNAWEKSEQRNGSLIVRPHLSMTLDHPCRCPRLTINRKKTRYCIFQFFNCLLNSFFLHNFYFVYDCFVWTSFIVYIYIYIYESNGTSFTSLISQRNVQNCFRMIIFAHFKNMKDWIFWKIKNCSKYNWKT